ncbi:chemotaxis response regulator protein-glutamate methylesterase [Dissulfurirhabdus thermomarina]|uniref:Protein-glutamate methylesterase/protein-glutamine glutaminase n=1 Tax=Dissulfurirhabdus thermomarina TaxID=1765737 RepID=A0A6N9TS17_DISTH|nr:chemotaxis response regulator protein-glutamate methylesterase [Dissulfurirhabdus thermomarina]NDY43220.1 chemotaxis response regulator protein-glutamate methylesterase [Dissulfurirhabdus thermomarina]NMX23221.1 chemotaxis response regulator protein-glutamate methylesterase [Dissulfurirhabdus thermomarina]
MRLGIVNDSETAVACLRRTLKAAPEHEVAWVARNGSEAVDFAAMDTPDLILMDLIMPVMDGVEATRRIMERSPCAILVVTASVQGNAGRVFEALGAGALDAVPTPTCADAEASAPLLRKIATLEKLIQASRGAARSRPAFRERPLEAPRRPDLLVIGASTGGPQALARLLAVLPKEFPAPVVVIQHVDARFARGMADWLDTQTPLRVRVARPGDRPRPGEVLVAETNDHLVFRRDGRVAYTEEPREHPYRPSVDVAFHCLARNRPGAGAAVLLTGMGRDGAEGLLALRAAGWYTVAQDKASCAVYGMPKAAAELGAAVDVLPPDEAGRAVLDYFRKGRRPS